jgi:hypothetical protein
MPGEPTVAEHSRNWPESGAKVNVNDSLYGMKPFFILAVRDEETGEFTIVEEKQ